MKIMKVIGVLSIFLCHINLAVAQNLGDVALANGFSTLVAAAVATGQIAVFSQPGPFSK